MEILAFNGGLNTRNHPQYLLPNQARTLSNSIVFDGTLKSMPTHKPLGTLIDKYFYKFKGKYVQKSLPTSFVEYDNKLFYSNEIETSYTTDGVNKNNLGASSPLGSLSLSVLMWTEAVTHTSGGTLLGDIYEYRITADGYTYSYTYDASDVEYATITFNISGTQEHKLYRKVDNQFLLIGAVTGGGTIVDGQVIENSAGTITDEGSYDSAYYFSVATDEVMLDGFRYTFKPSYGNGAEPAKIFRTKDGTTSNFPLPNGLNYNNGTKGRLVKHNNILYYIHIDNNILVGGTYVGKAYVYGLTGTTWVLLNSRQFNERLQNISISANEDGSMIFFYNGSYNKVYKFNGVFEPVTYSIFDVPERVSGIRALGSDNIYVITESGELRLCKLNDTFKYDLIATTQPMQGNTRLTNSCFSEYSNNGQYFTWCNGVYSYAFYPTTSKLTNILSVVYAVQGPDLDPDTTYVSFSSTDKGILYSIHSNVTTEPTYLRKIDVDLDDAGVNLGEPLGGDNLTGTFSYKFTDTEASGVNESAPSDASEDITVEKGNVVVDLSNIGTITGTHIGLYRTGGGSYNYYLVDEIDKNETSYIDYQATTVIQGNRLITPDSNIEAFADIVYLTYHRGRLWGVSGEHDTEGILVGDRNRLYFSELGDPLVWNETNYILLPQEITGLGSTPNGLVIFSENEINVLLGTTLDSFSVVNISSYDGCKSFQSIQSYKGSLIYMGLHGIQTCNGGSIANITRGVIDELDLLSPNFSCIVDDTYYVDINSQILAFDFRVEKLFWSMTKGSILGMENIDGRLELCIAGEHNIAFKGEELQALNYESGLITLGAINNLKEFGEIWVRYIGDLTMITRVDNTDVLNEKLVSDTVMTARFTIPKTKAKGYAISFLINGYGQILSIEYRVNLRKNKV